MSMGQVMRCLVNQQKRESLSGWLSTLERMLRAAGDIDGTLPPTVETVERMFPPFRTNTKGFLSAMNASNIRTTWA